MGHLHQGWRGFTVQDTATTGQREGEEDVVKETPPHHRRFVVQHRQRFHCINFFIMFHHEPPSISTGKLEVVTPGGHIRTATGTVTNHRQWGHPHQQVVRQGGGRQLLIDRQRFPIQLKHQLFDA